MAMRMVKRHRLRLVVRRADAVALGPGELRGTASAAQRQIRKRLQSAHHIQQAGVGVDVHGEIEGRVG